MHVRTNDASLKKLGKLVVAMKGKFDPTPTLGVSKKSLQGWGAALTEAGKSLASATEGVSASPVRGPGRKGPTAPTSPSRKKSPAKTPKKTPEKPAEKPGWTPKKKPGRPLE